MAKRAATTAAGKAEAPRKSGGALRIAGAAGALGALAILPATLILVPGMMPTAAAFFTDRQRPRYLTSSVAAMNLAGTLPFLIMLAKAGFSLEAAAHLLGDPTTWLGIYGTAALGWVIAWASPGLARGWIELQARRRQQTLTDYAAALEEEWGSELAGETRAAPPPEDAAEAD